MFERELWMLTFFSNEGLEFYRLCQKLICLFPKIEIGDGWGCGYEDDGILGILYIIIFNIRIIFQTCITPPPLLPSLKYKKSVGSPIALPIIQKKNDALLCKSIIHKVQSVCWNISKENYRTNRKLSFPVLCKQDWPPKTNKIPFWSSK